MGEHREIDIAIWRCLYQMFIGFSRTWLLIMKFKITWTKSRAVQFYTLVAHKCQFQNNYDYFTIYSPLYEAIENGSLCLDTGFGKHFFDIEQV